MLKIIETKSHGLGKSKPHTKQSSDSGADPSVESFLRLLKVYQSFSLSSEDKTRSIFAIAEDKAFGVYGGVVLYPQKVSDLSDKVGKVISTLQPNKEDVWCVRLCLCIDQDDQFVSLDSLDFKEAFYQNLLNTMMQFGERESLDFLVLTLTCDEYHNSRIYGSWPYILEIKPSSSSDGFFHGLLSLKNKKQRLGTSLRKYNSAVK